MRRDGSESDLKAQSFELAHEALFFLVPIELIEGGTAEFPILLRIHQDVIHNDQEGMGQGHCRSLLATPQGEAMILR